MSGGRRAGGQRKAKEEWFQTKSWTRTGRKRPRGKAQHKTSATVRPFSYSSVPSPRLRPAVVRSRRRATAPKVRSGGCLGGSISGKGVYVRRRQQATPKSHGNGPRLRCDKRSATPPSSVSPRLSLSPSPEQATVMTSTPLRRGTSRRQVPQRCGHVECVGSLQGQPKMSARR